MSYFDRLLSQKSHTLYLPKKHIENVQQYVHQSRSSVSYEDAPFQRQLDFWAFSFAIALARGLAPLDTPSSKWEKNLLTLVQS